MSWAIGFEIIWTIRFTDIVNPLAISSSCYFHLYQERRSWSVYYFLSNFIAPCKSLFARSAACFILYISFPLLLCILEQFWKVGVRWALWKSGTSFSSGSIFFLDWEVHFLCSNGTTGRCVIGLFSLRPTWLSSPCTSYQLSSRVF